MSDDDIWHQSPVKHWFGKTFTEAERPDGCGVCDREKERERYKACCLAMSRFLTFVWMEACATVDDEDWTASGEASEKDDFRHYVFTLAIDQRRFRLGWVG